MPEVIMRSKETSADPRRLPSVDIAGRQRLAVPRRQRDAARRGQAHVDGRGVENETVLVCRAAARLAAQDRAARQRQGPGGDHPRPIRQRWGAFLVQTGRASLTAAQTRSVRRRSTLDEIRSLTFGERIILKVRGTE